MFLLSKKQIVLHGSRQIIFYCNRVASGAVSLNKADFPKHEPIRPTFFSKLLDLPFSKALNMLKEYPSLVTIDQDDLKKTVKTLKSFNYSNTDIQNKPMILYVNALTIENRYDTLKECGCIPVTIGVLSKFITVMNRTVENLKIQHIIADDINVKERLQNCFTDIEIGIDEKEFPQSNHENIELKLLRNKILNVYLMKKLNCTQVELQKLWKVYGRLKHKSFASISQLIDILENELNFSKERILNNAFVLYGEPLNIRRILNEIPKIGDEDSHQILYRRPKILMTSCDSLKETIKSIKGFGIPENAILKCIEILTLGPDTIKARLKELDSIEEFQVFKTHPRVLRLVYYQNKAKHRLDFLNQIRLRCASLDVLSCAKKKFRKFTLEGTDRTKGRDVIIYLADKFKKPQEEIRESLYRHPNRCQIPLTSIQQTYDYLISKKFTQDEIYSNIILLLYAVERIDKKLKLMQNEEFFKDLNLEIESIIQLPNNIILNLCLYLIEAEFHFTGDGVWIVQNTQEVENFSAIIPDFIENSPRSFRSESISSEKLFRESSGS